MEGDNDIKIGAGGFERNDYESVNLQRGETGMGLAHHIMQKSRRVAWQGVVKARAALPCKRPQGTRPVRRLKIELGEHPRKFLRRVDRMVKELERVERLEDPKDVRPQYDTEERMN